MLEEQINDENLMFMVCHFSGYKIKPKYFALMHESPVIMESLKLIYNLWNSESFNSVEIQLIEMFFQEKLRFFSESVQSNELCNNSSNSKYSKRNLFLSVLFFSLMLLSGIGCIYSTFIFIPFVISFGLGLVLCTYLISVKNRFTEVIPKFDEIYNRDKFELNTLKKDLNKLRSFFAKKYRIKMTNVDSVYITLADEEPEDLAVKKNQSPSRQR